MSWLITPQQKVLTDPVFNNVSLLLHMDGSDGRNNFIDSSNNSIAVLPAPKASMRTNNKKFGASSAFFNDSYYEEKHWISIPYSNLIDFGSSSFTLEFYVYYSSIPWSYYLFNSGNDGIRLSGDQFGGGRLIVQVFSATQGMVNHTIGNMVLNTWHHFALCRDGNTFYVFWNGSLVYTSSGSEAIKATTSNSTIAAYNFLGYIDDFRITKGVCRYIANFTPLTYAFPNNPDNVVNPPTDPFFSNVSLLLHMNGFNGSTAFTDGSASPKLVSAVSQAQISTAQSKFGGASALFDGAGDYLSVSNSSFMNIDTAEYTIELWFYIAGNSPLDNGGQRNGSLITCFTTSGSTNNTWALGVSGNSTTTGTGLSASFVSTTSSNVTYTGTIAKNVWHHIALVKNGTNAQIYLNGSSVASATIGSTYTTSTTMKIGATGYAGYFQEFNGYIDELRITKGVARYTANFTPPDMAFPDA
jgi:hypothetical protein